MFPKVDQIVAEQFLHKVYFFKKTRNVANLCGIGNKLPKNRPIWSHYNAVGRSSFSDRIAETENSNKKSLLLKSFGDVVVVLAVAVAR